MLSTCWLTTPFSGCFNTAIKGGVGLHDSGEGGPLGCMTQTNHKRRAPRLGDRSRSEGWPMSQDDDKFFSLENTSAFSVFGNDLVLLGASKQPPPPAAEKNLSNGIAGKGGLPPAGLSSERTRGGVVTTTAPKSQNQILPSDFRQEKAHVRPQEQPQTPRKSKSMGRIHGTNPPVVGGSGGPTEGGGGVGGGGVGVGKVVEQQPAPPDNKKEGVDTTQASEPVFRGHRRVPSDGVAWRHSKALEKEQLGMEEDDKFFKRTYKSEYRKKFRPFSQYQYVDGKFSKSKAEKEPVAGNTWYKEVLELRKQAGQYRARQDLGDVWQTVQCRGWGVETASDRMAEIYNKQVELWEQVSRRSSLQALSLASAAPSRPISKAEKELENSRRSSPIKHTGKDRPHTAPSKHKPAPVHVSNKLADKIEKGEKTAEKIEKAEKVDKVADKVDGKSSKETTPRHHYDRTTGGDGLFITSPSHDRIEPIVSIDWTAARRSSRKTPPITSPVKDAAAKRRPPRAISIARTTTPKEAIKDTKTPKSTSAGRSVSAGPENRSPKRTSRPPSTHVPTPAVKPERRPRPTSLSTSSRRKGTDSAIPQQEAKKPSKKPHDVHASPKRSADLKNREEKRQSDDESKKDHKEKEKDSKDIFRESLKDGRKATPEPRFDPEKYEPVVKTPPEPTRVKSPDQVMVKSPDPVNWTVPLDTGKTFTVTHNIPEGESSRGTPSSEHRPPLEPRSRQTPEPTRIYQGSLAGTPITTAGTTPSATTATASSTVPQEKTLTSMTDSGSTSKTPSSIGTTATSAGSIPSQSTATATSAEEEKPKDPVSGVTSKVSEVSEPKIEKEGKDSSSSEPKMDSSIYEPLDSSKPISSEDELIKTSVESSKPYQEVQKASESEVTSGQLSSSASVSPNPPLGFSSGILSVVGSDDFNNRNVLGTNLINSEESFTGNNVAGEWDLTDNLYKKTILSNLAEDIQVFGSATANDTYQLFKTELNELESEDELKFEKGESDDESETKPISQDLEYRLLSEEALKISENIDEIETLLHSSNINFTDDSYKIAKDPIIYSNVNDDIEVHQFETKRPSVELTPFETESIKSDEHFESESPEHLSGSVYDEDRNSVEGSYDFNNASLQDSDIHLKEEDSVQLINAEVFGQFDETFKVDSSSKSNVDSSVALDNKDSEDELVDNAFVSNEEFSEPEQEHHTDLHNYDEGSSSNDLSLESNNSQQVLEEQITKDVVIEKLDSEQVINSEGFMENKVEVENAEFYQFYEHNNESQILETQNNDIENDKESYTAETTTPYEDNSATVNIDHRNHSSENFVEESIIPDKFDLESIASERFDQESRRSEKFDTESTTSEIFEDKIESEKFEVEIEESEKLYEESAVSNKFEPNYNSAEILDNKSTSSKESESGSISSENLEAKHIAEEQFDMESISSEKVDQESIASEIHDTASIASEKIEEFIASEKIEQEYIESENSDEESAVSEKLEQINILSEDLHDESNPSEIHDHYSFSSEKLEQEYINEKFENESTTSEKFVHEHNESEKLNQDYVELEQFDGESNASEQFGEEISASEKFDTENIISDKLEVIIASEHINEAYNTSENFEQECSPSKRFDNENIDSEMYDGVVTSEKLENIIIKNHEQENIESEESILENNAQETFDQESLKSEQYSIASEKFDDETTASENDNLENNKMEQYDQESYNSEIDHASTEYDKFEQDNLAPDVLEKEIIASNNFNQEREIGKLENDLMASDIFHQDLSEKFDFDNLTSSKLEQESVVLECFDNGSFEEDITTPNKLEQESVTLEKFNTDKFVEDITSVGLEYTTLEVYEQKNGTSESNDKHGFSSENFDIENIIEVKYDQESFESDKFDEERRSPSEKIDEESAVLEKFDQETLALDEFDSENIESEKLDQVSIASERLDSESIASENGLQESITGTSEKFDQISISSEKFDEDNINLEKFDKESLVSETFDQENAPAKFSRESSSLEMFDQEIITSEKFDQEIITSEKFDQVSITSDKFDQETIASEKFDQGSIASEKFDDQNLKFEKFNEDSLASESFDQESIATEQFDQENLAPDTFDQEIIASEELALESSLLEKFEHENIVSEKFDQESIASEKFDLELISSVKFEADSAESERLDQEKIVSEINIYQSDDKPETEDYQENSLSEKTLYENIKDEIIESNESERDSKDSEILVKSDEDGDSLENFEQEVIASDKLQESEILDKFERASIASEKSDQENIESEKFDQESIEYEKFDQENTFFNQETIASKKIDQEITLLYSENYLQEERESFNKFNEDRFKSEIIALNHEENVSIGDQEKSTQEMLEQESICSNEPDEENITASKFEEKENLMTENQYVDPISFNEFKNENEEVIMLEMHKEPDEVAFSPSSENNYEISDTDKIEKLNEEIVALESYSKHLESVDIQVNELSELEREKNVSEMFNADKYSNENLEASSKAEELIIEKQNISSDNSHEEIITLETHDEIISSEPFERETEEAIISESHNESDKFYSDSVKAENTDINIFESTSEEHYKDTLFSEGHNENNQFMKEDINSTKLASDSDNIFSDTFKTYATSSNFNPFNDTDIKPDKEDTDSFLKDESDNESIASDMSQRGSIPSIPSSLSLIQQSEVDEDNESDIAERDVVYEAQQGNDLFFKSLDISTQNQPLDISTDSQKANVGENNPATGTINNFTDNDTFWSQPNQEIEQNFPQLSYHQEASKYSFVEGNIPLQEERLNVQINVFGIDGQKLEDDVEKLAQIDQQTTLPLKAEDEIQVKEVDSQKNEVDSHINEVDSQIKKIDSQTIEIDSQIKEDIIQTKIDKEQIEDGENQLGTYENELKSYKSQLETLENQLETYNIEVIGSHTDIDVEQIIEKTVINKDVQGSKSHKINFDEIDEEEFDLAFKSTPMKKKSSDPVLEESDDEAVEELMQKDILKLDDSILDDIAYKVEKLQGSMSQMYFTDHNNHNMYESGNQIENEEGTEFYEDTNSKYGSFHHESLRDADDKSEQEEGFHDDDLSTDSAERSEKDPIEQDQSSDDESMLKDKTELNPVNNNESGIYDVTYDSRGNSPPEEKYEGVGNSDLDQSTDASTSYLRENTVAQMLNPFQTYDFTKSGDNKMFGLNVSDAISSVTDFFSPNGPSVTSQSKTFLNEDRLQSEPQTEFESSSESVKPALNEYRFNGGNLHQNGVSPNQEEDDWSSDESMVIHEELPDNKFPFIADDAATLKLADTAKREERTHKEYNLFASSIPEEPESESSPSATVSSFTY